MPPSDSLAGGAATASAPSSSAQSSAQRPSQAWRRHLTTMRPRAPADKGTSRPPLTTVTRRVRAGWSTASSSLARRSTRAARATGLASWRLGGDLGKNILPSTSCAGNTCYNEKEAWTMEGRGVRKRCISVSPRVQHKRHSTVEKPLGGMYISGEQFSVEGSVLSWGRPN